MRDCVRTATALAPTALHAGANDAESPQNRNHHALAPKRKRGDMATFPIPRFPQQLNRIAPGMKCRGLRAMTMNHRCQPVCGVPLTRPSVTLSRREKGLSTPKFAEALSARLRSLLTIVMQLNLRYRYCVQNGGDACNQVGFARTISLRTKGACKPGSDARTCNFEVVEDLLRLRPAERHGGRCLQMAISAPEIRLGLSPGRVARGSVDSRNGTANQLTPPPAYAAAPLSTGAKTKKNTATLGDKGNTTGALRPPLALRSFVRLPYAGD
jgi:hypothetical protein